MNYGEGWCGKFIIQNKLHFFLDVINVDILCEHFQLSKEESNKVMECVNLYEARDIESNSDDDDLKVIEKDDSPYDPANE